MVHHPHFVFDQGILPKGAAYWVALAQGHLR
jgi:hippurate hydrolase